MSLQGAISVTRFGLGARPDEINTASRDPEHWLLSQLVATDTFPDQALPSSRERLSEAMEYTRSVRTRNADEDATRTYRRRARQANVAEVTARMTFATVTESPFHERLVRFWSNHFTVAANSAQTRALAAPYEREAIRPHILGSFAQLAERAIFHAGMLVYLNNWQSIGPNSRAGQRRGRGLNENLAREILELHTVTPAAGYSQADVTAFAKALTGWTVGNHRIQPDGAGTAVFSDRLHESGRHSVLGRLYSDVGADQAKAIVQDLCQSPHTAQNIASKLARHFVSDTPPASLVEKLRDDFLETGGDLTSLYSVLVEAEEAWLPTVMKFKTPDELIVSTGRLIGLQQALVGDARDLFESFAQQPFTAPSPAGWPDENEAWNGPDAIMKRVEWANRLADRNSTLDGRILLEQGVGARVSSKTLQAVARAENPTQATAIALLSPEFQMR
ncbi:MAG: DUF1800 family protein [Pseudomonadota bacterium]